ncbi:MAG TPA: hypothetical protein VN455_00610 [Methanotrichaceae archaeon]|nr:hypothetical protein [Methanotrichaceae archaeon]
MDLVHMTKEGKKTVALPAPQVAILPANNTTAETGCVACDSTENGTVSIAVGNVTGNASEPVQVEFKKTTFPGLT